MEVDKNLEEECAGVLLNSNNYFSLFKTIILTALTHKKALSFERKVLRRILASYLSKDDLREDIFMSYWQSPSKLTFPKT